MNDYGGPPTNAARRSALRPTQGGLRTGRPVRRRPHRLYDPRPRTMAEALARLWVVGLGCVVLVVVLVVATGPGDISILRRLFIWLSTFVFGVWLLREHRRRLRVAQRRVIFVVCSASLILLLLILVFTAF